MIQLFKGDCLIESDKIESGSVDLILTDLPYGNMKGINNPLRPKSWGDKKYFEWDSIDLAKIVKISNRILRKNGKAIFFYSGVNLNNLINQQCDNFSYSYKMIWEKNEFGNVLMCNKAPVNYYEDILVFNKNYDTELKHPLRNYFKKVAIFINKPLSQINKYTKTNNNHFFRFNSKHFLLQPEKNYDELIEVFKIDKMEGFKTYKELKNIDNYDSIFNLWECKKFKSNILKYKRDKDKKHPTQKPVLLLEDLIKTFSNEGDNVVDLTMGSGSTGVACVNTNRNFIGIEMNEGYFNISQTRINTAIGQTKLF